MAAKKKTKRGREQKWKDLKAQEGVFTHTILRATWERAPEGDQGQSGVFTDTLECQACSKTSPSKDLSPWNFIERGCWNYSSPSHFLGEPTSPGPAPLRTPVHFLLRSPCLGRGKAADPEGPWATFNRIQVVHEPRGKRDTYLHKCQKSWLGKLTFP